MKSEWFDNQRKPRSNFRKLLQERIEKANSDQTPKVEVTFSEFQRCLVILFFLISRRR